MAEQPYTVFIRVPRPRGDFVDPPTVRWDTSKDVELWNILSGAAQTEIDWNELAQRFDATVPFLLQQVAYLTDRHASQVRAQVRKATATATAAAAAAKGSSAAPSPVPGGEPVGGPLGHHRTTSALSLRRDSPMPGAVPNRHDSGAGTPISTGNRANISRNTSGTTLTQLAAHNHMTSMASREGTGTPWRGAKAAAAAAPPPLRPIDTQTARTRYPPFSISTPVNPPSPDAAESVPASPDSSDSDYADDDAPAQSRIINRPPVWDPQKNKASYLGAFGEEDEDGVFHLPAKSPPLSQQARHPSAQDLADLAATLRGPELARIRSGGTPKGTHASQSQTSDSSIGSVSVVGRPGERRRTGAGGSLSFRSAAEMASRAASGGKSRGISREGSEGTPSMSSSFSDLEGSVTRSALEEYMGAMQDGSGLASRSSLQNSSYGGPRTS